MAKIDVFGENTSTLTSTNSSDSLLRRFFTSSDRRRRSKELSDLFVNNVNLSNYLQIYLYLFVLIIIQ